MFQSLKRSLVVLTLLLSGARCLFGFALLGPPNEAYQVPVIGYNVQTAALGLGDLFTVDVGAPKNIGQGYRWNTPTNYYTYDASFITFFGSNGIAAVDQAMATFNNLSNVSSYSKTLAEFPLNSSRVNFAAQADDLTDLKSLTMGFMLEELGLASPYRYTFGLHDRFLPGGATCPAYVYSIIERNFDPVTQTYSIFVNGQLLGFTVQEFCGLTTNPFDPVEADAQEYFSDPTQTFTAVASQLLTPGTFYTGLTRDDVGGLRYLYSSTNVANELVPTNTSEVVTNSQVSTLTTSNLAIFEAQALTNDAATLEGLYPGLIITATTNFFTNVITTNFTFFLTNVVGAPAGDVTIGAALTLTTNVQQDFLHTFANVVILHTGGLATQTIEQTSVFVQRPIGAPAGTVTLATNIISTSITTPFTNGDFYIQQSNQCDTNQILGVQLQQLASVSNAIPVITGTFGSVPQLFIAENVFTFTNFTYLIREVDCGVGTNTAALRQGMEKITFIRRDFDSLLSATFDPITNTYNLTAVSNTPIVQTFRRVVTAPDILFSADDLDAGPDAIPANNIIVRSFPNFDSTLATALGKPGPGTIAPGIRLTYNDAGPTYISGIGTFFVTPGGALNPDLNFSRDTIYGSFDGTTNLPIVYPDSVSLANVEAQIYFQITSGILTNAVVGVPYSAQIQVSGGSPLLNGSYSISTNVTGLPAGLSISGTGLISGVPTTVGTNDFVVTVTDAGSRTTSKVVEIPVVARVAQ